MYICEVQTESQQREGDVNKLDLYYAKNPPLPCGILVWTTFGLEWKLMPMFASVVFEGAGGGI